MGEVLLKAVTFLFIIALGFTLKKIGFFKEGQQQVLGKILLNITLPAAVVRTFADYQRDGSLLIVVLIGFLCAAIPLVFFCLVSWRLPVKSRIFMMLNGCGYNIGCFTLPFTQSFFGPAGAVVTCLFDTGNAMIASGGSYAVTSTLLGTGKDKASFCGFLKKLFSSVAFDTYLLMLLLAVLNLRLPQPVYQIAEPIAASNGFVAMLYIGTMLEISGKAEHVKNIAAVIGARLLFSTMFALLIYFCTPLPLQIRQILAVLTFSPIAGLTPVFVEKCGGDGKIASFANSVSIILSLVIMTCMVLAMGVPKL